MIFPRKTIRTFISRCPEQIFFFSPLPPPILNPHMSCVLSVIKNYSNIYLTLNLQRKNSICVKCKGLIGVVLVCSSLHQNDGSHDRFECVNRFLSSAVHIPPPESIRRSQPLPGCVPSAVRRDQGTPDLPGKDQECQRGDSLDLVIFLSAHCNISPCIPSKIIPVLRSDFAQHSFVGGQRGKK